MRLKNTVQNEFRSQGDRAALLLRASPIWAAYKTVFLFLSMKTEIETSSFLEAAFLDEKKVFAPKVENTNLVFYPLLSANGPFVEGPFGIKEPAVVLDKISTLRDGGIAPEDYPALIITPGLAFDRQGRRLGQGKGFYDRFFAQLEAEKKQYYPLGLCMDFQLIDEVPAEEYDKKVLGIITCKELLTLT